VKEPETGLHHAGRDQGIGHKRRLPEMEVTPVLVDLTSIRLADMLVEVREQKSDQETEVRLIRRRRRRRSLRKRKQLDLLMIITIKRGNAETHHLHQGHPDLTDGQIVIMTEEVDLDQEDIIIGDLSIDCSPI